MILPTLRAGASHAGQEPVFAPTESYEAGSRFAGTDGNYIVRFVNGADAPTETAALAAHGASVSRVYRHAFPGAVVRLSAQEAEALKRNPRVAVVEADGPVKAAGTQTDAPWGLDRSDQRDQPLSGTYRYPNTGAGVTAYIVDTGILANHADFGGRVRSGYTAVNDGNGTTDCNGHGTHVAGTVGGSTYGMAKGVSLVAVRVLDCAGAGSYSGVIAGLDWVAADHLPEAPAVVNMSLGGDASPLLDAALDSLIADGVTVVVAAGNDGLQACDYSPARAPAAITVAATDSTDFSPNWSNWGSCLDLFAPGDAITSDWHTSNIATNTIGGTSMAAPHVTGAAAVLLASQPSLSPADVALQIAARATAGIVTNPGDASPNLLLYSPPSVPGTPTGVSAVAGNASAAVTWTPPSGGDSAITSYTVIAYGGTIAARTTTVLAPATSVTVTGLTNGTAYTFTVTASTASDAGPPSAASAPITPHTVPTAPTGVTATSGEGSATLTWSAPIDNGGSAVTSYTVTAYAGATSVQTKVVTPITTATVTDLTNGTAYTFRVAATNAAGTGPQSAFSDVVTPSLKVPFSIPSGYWMIDSGGGVFAFGGAQDFGDGPADAVDIEPTPSMAGYWVLARNGSVSPRGDARFFGSALMRPGEEAASLSSTASGNGYWIFTNRGRVINLGDAPFFGDVSSLELNGPVLDSVATASGRGYWMVASDGGIFSFGDAKFYGSMGGTRLNKPVMSMAPDPDGLGYWLVASDGGIFAFDSGFYGSMGGTRLNRPVSGIVAGSAGYLMVAEDGGIFAFGNVPFHGSLGANPPALPVTAVALKPGG
jgi:subtilisin family serine protease